MNFSKSMIDLVREIRRRAPSEHKPGIKLANPELLSELLPWYQSSTDAIVKALIKELFTQAGDEWSQKLYLLEHGEEPAESGKTSDGVIHKDGKRYVTKVYRGQTQLVEVATESTAPAEAPVRMYRGQVVR